MSNQIALNISIGEALDKYSILSIKKDNIIDTKKLEEINKLTEIGTQGYPRKYLEKYSKLLDIPFDQSNHTNPILINDDKIICYKDKPLTAEFIWNTKFHERNLLVEYVFGHYLNLFKCDDKKLLEIMKSLMGYKKENGKVFIYSISDDRILNMLK